MMANDTPFRESDVLSHEFICQETDSQSSQVTVATKSEPCPTPQDETVSMSESSGIPEVPGRHKFTTCKDVGFFTAASSTNEAILSSCSESHTSNASGSTDGDYAGSGMQHQSSSNLLPLKNAARMSDLFRSGNEGDGAKGQIPTLESRESGISLNESLLLSVDLTSADLGTICDVNDKNYYRQMVLRSLLNADDTDQCESETRVVPEDEAALNEDKAVAQEVENIASENVVSSLVEAGTCYELGRVCIKSDERTGKFRVVQLNCSSQDVFEDATGSKHSGESLPAVKTVDTTNISGEKIITTDVLDTVLHGVSDRETEQNDNTSFNDLLPLNVSQNISDSVSETDVDLPNYSSGDNYTPSVDESKTSARQTEELAATETYGRTYRSRSENSVRQLERNARSLKNKSVLFLEALFRAGTENTLTAAVRAGLCFTAVFILLYSPSTLINILTLYLQLLVCAIFVDIFLN